VGGGIKTTESKLHRPRWFKKLIIPFSIFSFCRHSTTSVLSSQSHLQHLLVLVSLLEQNPIAAFFPIYGFHADPLFCNRVEAKALVFRTGPWALYIEGNIVYRKEIPL